MGATESVERSGQKANASYALISVNTTQSSCFPWASSIVNMFMSTEAKSLEVGEDTLTSRLEKCVFGVRPETREFYEHLDAFFKVKQIIQTEVDRLMPNDALNKYSDILPPDSHPIIQECVPLAELKEQLDVLYACAEEAKRKFDSFARQLVQQVGL